MHHLDPLTARNRTFAATDAHVGVSVMPRNQVYVITCLDPAAFLGVGLGDAMVVRNAGGRVTDEVVKDVAFISYLAEVMVGDGPLFQVAVSTTPSAVPASWQTRVSGPASPPAAGWTRPRSRPKPSWTRPQACGSTSNACCPRRRSRGRSPSPDTSTTWKAASSAPS